MSFAPIRAAPDVRPDACRPGLTAVPPALTAASIFLIFAVSPMALQWMGFNYVATGGNPLTKIHPGTFVAALAVLAWIARLGPRAFIERVLAFPGLVVMAAGLAFLMVYDVLSVHEPVTPLIDTYGLPILIAAALLVDPTAPRPGLRYLIHGVFALNAVVGLVEFFSGKRLFPLVVNTDGPKVFDWRSSALFGHPLTNALLISTYVVALLVGARGLSARARVAMILLQGAALVVFGGRTGLVLSLFAIACTLAVAGFRLLAGARMRLTDVIAAIAAVPLLAIAAVVLAERGFFDRLIERFTSDAGSAETRVIMLRLLSEISWTDLLFGTGPAIISTLVQIEGIELGIESFEVAMVIMFGIVPCLIFFAALIAFLVEIARASRATALLPLGCFFLIASTSMSIASKTPELGMAVALVLILMRDPPAAAAG